MAKSPLTPEQAMRWALVDHRDPDDNVGYSVDQQIRAILFTLDEAGYQIVRKTDDVAVQEEA